MSKKKNDTEYLYFVELSLNTPSGVFVAKHPVDKDVFENVEQQMLRREEQIVFRNLKGKRVLVNTRSVFTIELAKEKKLKNIIVPNSDDPKIVQARN